MKRLVLFLMVAVLSATQVSAQGSQARVKLFSSTQAVLNTIVNNPNMMVITGRITDAETKLPITDAKINFDKFGDELTCAAIDKDGNYALALNKTEIGEQIKIIFKIEGYQKYIAKAVKSDKPVVDIDLNLWPDESANNTAMKYTLSDDPYGKLVIKF